MDIGYVVGWIGVAFGLCVPLPQLIKIIKTKSLNDIALGTYILLSGCLSCYFIHAWYINSPVFMVAQGVNLLTNGTILVLLIRHKLRRQ